MFQIPNSYPPVLVALIHKQDKPIVAVSEKFCDWQTIAQYRNGQESLDLAMEHGVVHALAMRVTEGVTVFQDQNHKQGRRYYASLVAMSERRFLNLLYEAYLEGQSSARSMLHLTVKEEK